MTIDQNPPNSTTLLNKKIKKTNNNIHKSNTHLTSNSVSSSSSSYCSKAKGVRLFTNRRNPRVFKWTRSQADALALPLGMSIAAFVAKVLEKKDATEEKMSVDHLSEVFIKNCYESCGLFCRELFFW
ncbi:hypothetical protein Hdeb2414_s0006g00213771 [Helianthus debilis subsp. tardiflorus]